MVVVRQQELHSQKYCPAGMPSGAAEIQEAACNARVAVKPAFAASPSIGRERVPL
jgi:hypothetical protein